ncbi:interstitial collagenase [Suncus etruscus]|uniref:interstitial collagenase n=1 Tax=Suncus etruscus TaxID=109475 RepID=UPI00210FC53B|nr:interstitial collagenase [Suncus etruscus]
MHHLPLLLLLWVMGSWSFPTSLTDPKEQDMKMVQTYLESYYRLENDGHKIAKQRDHSPVVEKLKQMQKFFGLKVTGKPDAETLKVMRQPRCGVPDVAPLSITSRIFRWEHTSLTYRIETYTKDMHPAEVDRAIEKAFNLWSQVTPLTFTKVFEGQADIMISFVYGDHYDNSPFDGPGNTLAHAFPPGSGLGGDVHFDEDETWTNNLKEYNLYRVAAHELGHSLGLSHSMDIGALMYPSYFYSGEVQFSQSDIQDIQALYGPSKNPFQPEAPKTPEPCDSKLTFDAITTLRGEIIFFKDRFYLRVIRNYPVELQHISDLWPALPNKLQAAYEVTNKDEVRFFKGNKYWAFQGHDMLPGYPKDIYVLGFPRTVKSIDAAVYEETTSKTYFFVDNKYWRYDETKESMDKGYPKLIQDGFPGIGNKVDAVFSDDNFFYFFHGTRQYEFDPKTKSILRLRKTNSWFNCRKKY